MSTVRVRPFYTEWSGHRIEHLDIALQYLRRGSSGEQNREVLFLAGDSTLDNKYWILHTPAVDAINGYESFLRPARMMQDVSYWINREILARGQGERAVCLNTAIEATTLGERSRNLYVLISFCSLANSILTLAPRLAIEALVWLNGVALPRCLACEFVA